MRMGIERQLTAEQQRGRLLNRAEQLLQQLQATNVSGDLVDSIEKAEDQLLTLINRLRGDGTAVNLGEADRKIRHLAEYVYKAQYPESEPYSMSAAELAKHPSSKFTAGALHAPKPFEAVGVRIEEEDEDTKPVTLENIAARVTHSVTMLPKDHPLQAEVRKLMNALDSTAADDGIKRESLRGKLLECNSKIISAIERHEEDYHATITAEDLQPVEPAGEIGTQPIAIQELSKMHFEGLHPDDAITTVPAETTVATESNVVDFAAVRAHALAGAATRPIAVEPIQGATDVIVSERLLAVRTEIERFKVLLRRREQMQAELDQTSRLRWLKRGSLQTDITAITRQIDIVRRNHPYLMQITHSAVDLATPAGREIERRALQAELGNIASFDRQTTLDKIVATQRADLSQTLSSVPTEPTVQPTENLNTRTGRLREEVRLRTELDKLPQTPTAPLYQERRQQTLGELMQLERVKLAQEVKKQEASATVKAEVTSSSNTTEQRREARKQFEQAMNLLDQSPRLYQGYTAWYTATNKQEADLFSSMQKKNISASMLAEYWNHKLAVLDEIKPLLFGRQEWQREYQRAQRERSSLETNFAQAA